MFGRHVIKDLDAYLDNQLSAREKLEVEAHLKDCQVCSRELSKLRMVSEKLKTLPAPDLGPFFAEVVKEKIRDPRELERGAVKMKRKAWYLLIPSGALAGILVFVFVGQAMIKSDMQSRMRMKGDYSEYSTTKDHKIQTAFRDKMITSNILVPESQEYADVEVANSADGYAMRDEQYAPHFGHKAEKAGEGGLALRESYGSYPDNASVIVIQPTLPATGEGEKIIRTAKIRLEVENGQDTYKQASAVCQELGGYLAASNLYQDREGRQAGTITMRIPKDKFLTALEKLSALGKVEGSSTQSQDVSQEYANLQAQLDASMVVYKKMLEALQKRQNTIPEAVRLESELTPVLQRIAHLKNRMEGLNNSVSFTTVNLHFHEAVVSAKVLKEARQDIQKSMLAATINAVRFFGNALPAGIVLVVWIVLIAVVAVLIRNFIRKLFKRG